LAATTAAGGVALAVGDVFAPPVLVARLLFRFLLLAEAMGTGVTAVGVVVGLVLSAAVTKIGGIVPLLAVVPLVAAREGLARRFLLAGALLVPKPTAADGNAKLGGVLPAVVTVPVDLAGGGPGGGAKVVGIRWAAGPFGVLATVNDKGEAGAPFGL